QIIGPVAAKAAYAESKRLTPEPWPADWAQATRLLEKIDRTKVADAFWIAGGTGDAEAKNFYTALQQGGGVRTISDPDTVLYVLLPPQGDEDGMYVGVMRANSEAPAILSVAGMARDGHILAHIPVNFTAGAPYAKAPLDVPVD